MVDYLSDELDLIKQEQAPDLESYIGLPTGPSRSPGAATPAFDQAAAQRSITEYAQSEPIPEPVNLFTRSVKNLLNGVRLGVVGEVETFDNLAKLVSKYTGLPKTDALQKVMDWARPTDEDLAAGGNSLYDKVVRSFGHAIPLIAQLAVGSGVISAGLKATKLPTAFKLGQKAVTGGQRLLKAKDVARATGLAAQSGKKLKGVVNLAEPLAFAGYEGTHEALRPGATLGSTLKKTGLGGLMGTALPLFRGLPQVARQAAAGGLAAGLTTAEGGGLEDALTSGITMAGLASMPEAVALGKRVLKGKAPAEVPDRVADVSDTAQTAGSKVLGNYLTEKLRYDPESVNQWSNYQKQQVMKLSPTKTLNMDFNRGTGHLTVKLGSYSFVIPRQNPKSTKTTPIKSESQAKEKLTDKEPESLFKGTLEARTIEELKNETRELERMSIDVLEMIEQSTTNKDLKLEVQVEKQRRLDKAEIARAKSTNEEHGYFAPAMTYIKEVYGANPKLTTADIGDIAVKGLLPGESTGTQVQIFLNYLQKNKIPVEPKSVGEEITPGDIEAALNETLKERTDEPISVEPKGQPTSLAEALARQLESERGGAPPETAAQKQKRMREWAENWFKEKKAEEETGGPPIKSTEGVRELQREAVGGVIAVRPRAGVTTTRRGGLKGRGLEKISEEVTRPGGKPFKPAQPVEIREELPKSSEEAYEYGKTLRGASATIPGEKARVKNEISKIWTKYLAESNAWEEATYAEKRAMGKRMLENALRRDIIESYYGGSKTHSIPVDKLIKIVEADKTAEALVVTKKPTAKVKEPSELEKLTQKKEPSYINLFTLKSKNAAPVTDFESRAQKIVEISKKAAKGEEWKPEFLRNLTDESLDKIIKYNLRPSGVTMPEEYNKAQLTNLKQFRVRVPGAEIEATFDPKLDKLRKRLRGLHYKTSVFNSIDWDKVYKLKEQGVKLTETVDVPGARIREVGFSEAEGADVSTPEGQFARESGIVGVDPEYFAGPMVALVLNGKTIKAEAVVAKLMRGKSVLKAPEGVWKGYQPGERTLKGIPLDEVRERFIENLKTSVDEANLRTKYGDVDTELGIIRESLPGLAQEIAGEEAIIKNLDTFLTKYFQQERAKPDLNFEQAAGNAFVRAWAGIKAKSSPEAKTQAAKTVGKALSLEGEELPEGLSEAELEMASYTQRGGPPYKPKDIDKTAEASRKLEEKFGKAVEPITDGDRLMLESEKVSTAYKDYRDIVDLMNKNIEELKTISKELFNTSTAREASTGDPQLQTTLSEKLTTLQNRRLQVLTDQEYLKGIRDWFSRTTKPFEMSNIHLEKELSQAEDGIDGSIISKGGKKGGTFYLVQGPNGEKPQLGLQGHKIAAQVDVKAMGSKGEILNWMMPEGIDPRAEDAIYNSILERYTWGERPVALKPISGNKRAEIVEARRPSQKYKVWDTTPYELRMWHEYIRQGVITKSDPYYQQARQQYREGLIRAAESVTKREYTKYGKEMREEFLRRAQSLIDGQIDYELETLYKNPRDLGILDPKWETRGIDFMPLFDRIGDPTQSRIPVVARVGNLAMQTNLSIAKFVKQYTDMAEDYLGAYKSDTLAKQRIFRHLVAEGDKAIRAKHPDWIMKSTDENAGYLRAAKGYRLIMDDMADLFNLKEKGLYRDNYATLSYDIEKLWNNIYRDKLATSTEFRQLPASILSKLEPEDFVEIHRIANLGEWTKLDPVDQAFLLDRFFKNNVGYQKWEMMPEIQRSRVPKQKFIQYFQHRTSNDVMEMAMSEDIWDLLMTYIPTVVHDGVISDFFLPKARSLTANLRAAGVGETYSVRGYLDTYVKQVSGQGRNTPATMFMDSLFRTLNNWIGKQAFPESGMMAETANIYQQWLYRGTLGIDTAIRNLTQSLYTIAEVGPYNWVKGLKDYVEAGITKSEKWKTFAEHRGLIEEFFEQQVGGTAKTNPTLYEKARKLDQKVTALALHPMRITEHVNRGIAYFAALNDAAKQGLSFDKAHIVGMNGAQKYAHPYEMSEIEWNAVNRMYKTQFGYGKTHLPPMLAGPAMAFFKPFLTFPTRSLQFASNLGKEALGIEKWGQAVGKGAGEVWLTSDKAKLTRFLALTGFMAFAPQLLASTLGIDAGYLWGKGLFPNNFSPLWLQMIENFYVGVLGGLGMDIPPSAQERQKARKALLNMSYMMAIPQWRYIKKGVNVKKNLEQGYHTMGPKELPAYETTFAKEFVNMLGFPPYTKDAKQLIWDAHRERGDINFYKEDALREAAKYYEKGDYEGAVKILNKVHQKHDIVISEADINDYIRYQQNTTAFESAERGILSSMKPKWRSKLEAGEQRYLPKGPGKQSKSFWTNPARAMPEMDEMAQEEELRNQILQASVLGQSGLTGMIGLGE